MSELSQKNIECILKKSYIREMRQIKFKEIISTYELQNYQQAQFEKKHTLAHNMQIKNRARKKSQVNLILRRCSCEKPPSPSLYTLKDDQNTSRKLQLMESRNKIMLINNSILKKNGDESLTHSYILKRVKSLFKSISRRRSILDICSGVDLDHSTSADSPEPSHILQHRASIPPIRDFMMLPEIKTDRRK